MKHFATLALLLAGCAKDNPYYMGGDDTGGTDACETAADCTVGTPACDVPTGSCVACTVDDIGACGGTTPICSDVNTCAPCGTHDECSAEACLPTGACGGDAEVAYVAAGGNDANDCSLAAPCATLTHAATVGKPYVKLQNDIDEAVSFSGVTVEVLAAPGTVIRRSATNGPIVTLANAANVKLSNVVIRDGATAQHAGISVGGSESLVQLTLDRVAIINNAGIGMSIGNGTLTMTRSVVANNNGGGASITANFEITNSMFVKNGTNGTFVGGLTLTPGVTKHVFAFNTVAHNVSMYSAGRDLTCAMALNVTSSIITGNAPTLYCSFDYSLLDANPSTGTGNKTGSPDFIDTTVANAMAPDFYRIGASSAAKDSAAPSSDVMSDIDGDDRPQGGVRDIGADEYK